MSASVAYSFPATASPAPQPQQRHIEIVSTRSQRRERPRLFYAVVTVGGLFAILLAQLLLSIVISDGAYEISALQVQQKELVRDQQTVTEQLQVLQSPQHLAANAAALGMVTNANPVYLRLSDGMVFGAPAPATASSSTALGDDGALIANSLLVDVPLATPAAPEVTAPASTSGAPAADTAARSVASRTEGLPSPITR